MKSININNFTISNKNSFFLISGPCVLENFEHPIMMAQKLIQISNEVGIKFVFKSSFDKANRTNINSSRGIGIKDSIKVFEKIKKEYNCPILTDVHNEMQCEYVSEFVDIIQIPAFLCRQTDLLIAAGKTNKIINIKKGQFLSPYEIPNIIEKITSTNNNKILLTERGVTFGYNNLVTDFRSLEIMKKTQYPVIFDASHSVQEPGGSIKKTGGKREFIPTLSKAAVAVGIAGLFIETHDDPENAPSDGPNMLHLKDLKDLLSKLIKINNIIKN